MQHITPIVITHKSYLIAAAVRGLKYAKQEKDIKNVWNFDLPWM